MTTVTYPTGWSFTGHALLRMDEMGLSASEIHAALEDADLTYPGLEGADRQRREVRVADGLAVVVACEARAVITIMWHRGERRTYVPPT